jgi:hypothetical protein
MCAIKKFSRLSAFLETGQIITGQSPVKSSIMTQDPPACNNSENIPTSICESVEKVYKCTMAILKLKPQFSKMAESCIVCTEICELPPKITIEVLTVFCALKRGLLNFLV